MIWKRKKRNMVWKVSTLNMVRERERVKSWFWERERERDIKRNSDLRKWINVYIYKILIESECESLNKL
jgi:hypothetical protein